MGNRHLEHINSVGIIHEYPFKDIVPVINDQGKLTGEYQLAPGFGGATFYAGKPQYDQQGRIINYDTNNSFQIDLGPPIESVPPQPINGDTHVEETIRAHQADIIDLASTVAGDGLVVIDHGSRYGLIPEIVVAQILKENGFRVPEGSFPRVGGRKRMQKHAVVFSSST